MNTVIDRALESLEELGEFLSDEVVEETADQHLAAKLQAIREVGRPSDTRQLQLRGCEACD